MQDKHIAVETIQRYKHDTKSIYHIRFVNDENRPKAFRSIWRGVSPNAAEVEK